MSKRLGQKEREKRRKKEKENEHSLFPENP